MDSMSRILLDRVQRSFPLVPEPYHALSEGLGISGGKVCELIGTLKERKLIRQISAIFNTGALGYRSSLVAMAVPEKDLEHAASAINRYPGVSHNYLRPGNYNMWFTVAVPPGKALERTVVDLAQSAGGWPALILPAIRKYKLAVVLDVLEEGEGELSEERGDLPPIESTVAFEATDENIRIVRCIQEDLPLVEAPFRAWAESLDMGETKLIETMNRWLQQGFIRRFAAVLNHRQVGFSSNGMVVWNCPRDRIDEYGRILSSYPEVSHCYQRPSYSEWPFNLYAMIHGRSADDCRKVAERLGEAIGMKEYEILFSTKEFKKIRLKLFWS